MKTFDLQTEVSGFGEVLQYSERCLAGDLLTCALCELFALKYAYKIRGCIAECVGTEVANALERGVQEDSLGGCQRRLPKAEEARGPALRLFPAVVSRDKTAIWSALDGMRVMALCPVPLQQFSRMERIADRVVGPAKMVFWVELSFFAAELGDYERASIYASEAHNFDPIGWELYSLTVIEGLVALNAGKNDEAIKSLDTSVSACLTDGHACLGCGTSPPNFLLAEKLLERGKRIEVISHLSDCKFVWRFLRSQIEEWIRVIESGGSPSFPAGGTWRLATQCQNARLIDSGQYLAESSMPQSRNQVIAEVERMRAAFKLPKEILLPRFVEARKRKGRWPIIDQ